MRGWYAVHKVGLFLSLALAAAGVCNPAHAAEHALLIGIGQYQDKQIGSLEGPIPDVVALQETLIQLGMARENIKTLINQEATRAGILKALTALTARTRTGDKIFVYFSGHGTSALDEDPLPMPHTSGALVPYDFAPRDGDSPATRVRGLIVGRSDLLPIFSRMEEGRQVLVVFDACYSGQTVRSLGPRLPNRYLNPFPPRSGDKSQDRAAVPYPYRHVFYIGASEEYEWANDIPGWALAQYPTVDGKPHGALTDALLRLLQGKLDADADGDGQSTHGEVAAALAREVNGRFANQHPQSLPKASDERRDIRDRAFFLMSSRSVGAPLPPESSGPLRVRVENAGGQITQELAKLPNVRVTDGEADLRVYQEDQELFLLLPNRQPLARFAMGQDRELSRRVAIHTRLRALAAAPASDRNAPHVSLAFSGVRQGGKMVQGERFGMTVRSDATVYLLMLEITPQGAISVLYPFKTDELAPLAANTSKTLRNALKVEPPWGTDFIKLFAFQEKPPLLARLVGQTALEPDDPLYQEIECLVGVAPGCQPSGMAQDSLSIISYPAHELSRITP